MAKAQLGFDIGTAELKIAQVDGGGVRRTVVASLPDNLVREGRILSYDAMGDFIRETLKKNRIRGKRCSVVLPAGLAFLRTVTMPAMTVEQLAVNLPFEFKDYVTDSKDKYFYDYALHELRNGPDGTPVDMTLLAAATAKETIADYAAMFRRAGLKLTAAAPVECAYANLLRAYTARSGDGEAGEFCILDLGHSATRIHIYRGGTFEVTRVIDLGNATLDTAIAEAMSVDEHVARSYKVANHEDVQSLAETKGVYSAIAVEVMKAINFYSGFSNRESTLSAAYLCGGGGKVEGLRAAIGETVDLTLHSVEELLPHTADAARNLEFCAAAAGIAMQTL